MKTKNNKIKQADLFEVEEDEHKLTILVYQPCSIIFSKEGKKKNGKIEYD